MHRNFINHFFIRTMTNVEKFNQWMVQVVKSKWLHNDKAMCHARAKVASHTITSLKSRING
ncbi:hypothetical protein FUMI01_10590 [Flavobacterium sp. UMI-01]|nr:hypothetical protein FUMI01_10590 [Flavobacterium sp. UMI-01]